MDTQHKSKRKVETSVAMKIQLLITVAIALSLPVAAQAQSITKCQDADGNWHYGDFAAEACDEEATVTEIDERGRTVEETDAPPSEEELEAEEAERRAEQQEAERQAREREANERLLRTYDSVEGIIQARDARLEAMADDLETNELFRQDLVDERDRLLENDGDQDAIRRVEEQIQEYDDVIESIEADRQETMEKYNADIERFRELTE